MLLKKQFSLLDLVNSSVVAALTASGHWIIALGAGTALIAITVLCERA